MHHIAIMNPKLKFIDKILSGEKTIETRWYKNRIAPWDKIKKGDVIYFKNSGKDVSAKAEVEKVEQFDKLNPEKVTELVKKYYKEIGIDDNKYEKFITKHLNKNYAILIWLNSPTSITPFKINKAGFGNAAAWLSMEDINKIILQKQKFIL